MGKGSRRVAAIDVGSNTVHVAVFDVDDEVPVRRLSRSVLLKLGCEVLQHESFKAEVIDELAGVLDAHIKRARRAGASEILIAATGAFRRATNGVKTARALSRSLQIPVHLLHAHVEARLSFLGVLPDLSPGERHLIIDSGGLSTELAVTAGRRLQTVASLPVGGALMTGLQHDPPLPLEWARLMVTVAETLKNAPPMPRSGFGRALALGGAAHRFEELLGKKRGKSIHMSELEAIATRLLSNSSKVIGSETGIEPQRIALLTASSLIVGIVMQHYGIEKIRVSHRGLRDGMVQALVTRGANWWR